MWRIPRPALPFVFAFGLVLNCVPALGQSLPDKKEVMEWVRKAQEASNLQSPDAAPYHLVAKIRYTINEKAMDGTYEILWSAPDRYRVEFRMGDIGETELVLGDKKYVKRNTPTMSVPMFSISSLLFSSTPMPSAPSSETVHKLFWLGDGSNRNICAIVGESVTSDHELCFDADTTELTATHTHPKAHSSVVGAKLAMDLTDYVSLGKMRYPQSIIRLSGPEAIDATIEKWEGVQKFDENVFAPLSNSIIWDWCPAPKIEMPKSNSSYFTAFGVDPGSGTLSFPYFGIYKVVRADGTVKEATLLFSDPKGAKELLSTQRHERAAVHVCGGKPVEYESMFVMWPVSPVH